VEGAVVASGAAGRSDATPAGGYVRLRPAEMFVLQWFDLDIARGEIHINRSLGNPGEITLPKNGLTQALRVPSASCFFPSCFVVSALASMEHGVVYKDVGHIAVLPYLTFTVILVTRKPQFDTDPFVGTVSCTDFHF